jgi:hypothetical protein
MTIPVDEFEGLHAQIEQLQIGITRQIAELEQLRQHDKEATDLTIDQQVEIGRLYLALKRLVEDGGSDARRRAMALLAERGA